MIAMWPAAIAGPDAQRHGRGNAGVARLDLRYAMLITQILEIDLPSEGQSRGHALHEGASFGIDARTTLQPSLQSGDEEDTQWPIRYLLIVHGRAENRTLTRATMLRLRNKLQLRQLVPQGKCPG